MKPALIFDMDGVLIDNTPYQARAFQLLFRDLGLSTNARKLLQRLNGMPATNILKTVFRSPVPEKQLKEYSSQREFLYRTLYWSKRRETPGLSRFLEAARAAGFRIALGTSSPPETIAYIIDHLDLRRFFDVVIGKEDVERGKPHGDTFAIAATKLGARPEDCIVFEDALLGEQAAYKAGMRCVAVASGVPAKAFQAPLAVIKDFTELTPERLLELLAEQPKAPKPDKQRAQRNYMQLT
ncbi:HAD-IA family hydrolase [Hymenobacter sp. 5317J-9]|uniref:HAD family hydrolase n=1 Tax=Hymenobacter sp. 5317J-9 TaxID=2932250 RepID=UPI001FD677E7|nr:HAD-IA family hydrolase [Hymenobacter sp. 5317J-9]UOQ97911.1 HAD-IA family hydrolase [Hymenobacter sp. 5317J-9]